MTVNEMIILVVILDKVDNHIGQGGGNKEDDDFFHISSV